MPVNPHPADHRLVAHDEAALGVFGVDAIGDVVDQVSQKGALAGQGLLRLLAVADVVDDGVEDGLSLDLDPAAEHLDVPDRPVGPPVAGFEADLLRGPDLVHRAHDRFRGQRVDLLDRHLPELVARPAVVVRRSDIGLHDLPGPPDR